MVAAQIPLRAAAPAGNYRDPSRALVGRLLRTGIVLAATAPLLQLVLHLVNGVTIQSSILDANSEGNPFVWASTVAAFSVALCALIGGLAHRVQVRLLLSLAASIAFLSLDDAVVLHERIAAKVLGLAGLSVTYDSVLWPALYLPLLALTALLLFSIARGQPEQIRRLFYAGLALLLLAVVAEATAAPWSDGRNTVELVVGGIEESAELAGWILLASAMASASSRWIVAAALQADEGPATTQHLRRIAGPSHVSDAPSTRRR